MAFRSTDHARVRAFESLPVQADGCARRAWHRTAGAITGIGGRHFFNRPKAHA